MSAEFENKVLEELKNINGTLDKHNQSLNQLTHDVNNINTLLEKHDQSLNQLTHDVNNINTLLEKHDQSLNQLTHDVSVMKESIVLIEHKVSFEIPALFDGYAMSRDMQEIQHSRLNSLSIKVENHDNRISILEHKTV